MTSSETQISLSMKDESFMSDYNSIVTNSNRKNSAAEAGDKTLNYEEFSLEAFISIKIEMNDSQQEHKTKQKKNCDKDVYDCLLAQRSCCSEGCAVF